MNLGAAARVRGTPSPKSSTPPHPTNAMHSRRSILSMGTFSPMHISAVDGPVRSVLSASNLPQSGWQVLGADLNCSESAWALPGRPRIARRRRLLHCGSSIRPMSGFGLGRAETPTPAAHVGTTCSNLPSLCRMMLRARCLIPCWKIVFSTFRRCMSFHTARVRLDQDGLRPAIVHVPFTPKVDRRFTVHPGQIANQNGIVFTTLQPFPEPTYDF